MRNRLRSHIHSLPFFPKIDANLKIFDVDQSWRHEAAQNVLSDSFLRPIRVLLTKEEREQNVPAANPITYRWRIHIPSLRFAWSKSVRMESCYFLPIHTNCLNEVEQSPDCTAWKAVHIFSFQHILKDLELCSFTILVHWNYFPIRTWIFF